MEGPPFFPVRTPVAGDLSGFGRCSIDPGYSSILCTCYVNKNDLEDNYFEFYDGGQFLPNMKLKTLSVEILIEHLVKYNINNKSRNYPKNVLEDTTPLT